MVYLHRSICDTLPLDNPKTYLHLALPYITWGLIWDLKNKIQREIPIEIFYELSVSQFSKYKQWRKVLSLKKGKISNSQKKDNFAFSFKNHQIQTSGMS